MLLYIDLQPVSDCLNSTILTPSQYVFDYVFTLNNLDTFPVCVRLCINVKHRPFGHKKLPLFYQTGIYSCQYDPTSNESVVVGDMFDKKELVVRISDSIPKDIVPDTESQEIGILRTNNRYNFLSTMYNLLLSASDILGSLTS